MGLIKKLFSNDILSLFFQQQTRLYPIRPHYSLKNLSINLVTNAHSDDIITWVTCGLIQNVWPNLNTLSCYQEKDISPQQLNILYNTIQKHCQTYKISKFKLEINFRHTELIPLNWHRDRAYLIYTLPPTEDI
mgnify:CR=1 FL=1